MSSSAKQTQKNASGTKVPANTNEVLEEDDEFQEFDLQEWRSADNDNQDGIQWKNDWDDDDGADEDFVKQLRDELKKN